MYCTCSVGTSVGLSTAESAAPRLFPLCSYLPWSSDGSTGTAGCTGAQTQTIVPLLPVLKSVHKETQHLFDTVKFDLVNKCLFNSYFVLGCRNANASDAKLTLH